MTTQFDFKVEIKGSIVLLSPQTDSAREWVDKNLRPGPDIWWFNTVAIDHDGFADILGALEAEGFLID